MLLHSFRHPGRLRGWFVALTVLALCLKALMPTGYMIAAVDGHARLLMCPAGMHQPFTMHHESGAMDMTLAQHMPSAEHAAHAAQHAAADCPFALAAAAAIASGAPDAAEPYFVLLPNAAPVVVASIPAAPPLRHRAPRGPPSLA